MRPVILAALLLLLAGVATAAAIPNPATASDAELQQAITAYNNNTELLPGAAAALVSGERVNANISTGQDYVVFGVVFDGKRIASYRRGGVDDPTVTAYTSSATIDSVANADDPRQAAVRAYREKDIRFRTHTLWSAVKLGVIRVLLPLL